MKIRFYVDIWPHTKASDICFATANPGEKMAGCKRFAFDVEVPSHLLHQPDVISPEVKGPFVIGSDDETRDGYHRSDVGSA